MKCDSATERKTLQKTLACPTTACAKAIAVAQASRAGGSVDLLNVEFFFGRCTLR